MKNKRGKEVVKKIDGYVLQNNIYFIVVESMVGFADNGGTWAVAKLNENKIINDVLAA
jgi:hypothetical protein